MADDIIDEIVDEATSPKSATVDGMSATSHPIPDMLKANHAGQAQKALSATHFGAVFRTLKFGSAPGT